MSARSRLRRGCHRVAACGAATVLAGTAAAVLAAAPAAAATGGGTYVVVPGDTVWALAARYGVTRPALIAANGLHAPYLLRIGQHLLIPMAGARAGDGDGDSSHASSGPSGAATAGATSSDGSTGSSTGASASSTGSTAALTAASVPIAGHEPAYALAHYPAVAQELRSVAAGVGVPAALLEAVAWQESGWQSGVTSVTGARGVGQVEPATAQFVTTYLMNAPAAEAARPDNIHIAGTYLAWLLFRSGGNERLALASYYQGPTSVRRYGVAPGTARYVDNVMALAARFSAAGTG